MSVPLAQRRWFRRSLGVFELLLGIVMVCGAVIHSAPPLFALCGALQILSALWLILIDRR